VVINRKCLNICSGDTCCISDSCTSHWNGKRNVFNSVITLLSFSVIYPFHSLKVSSFFDGSDLSRFYKLFKIHIICRSDAISCNLISRYYKIILLYPHFFSFTVHPSFKCFYALTPFFQPIFHSFDTLFV
jgi:hypothetical protein